MAVLSRWRRGGSAFLVLFSFSSILAFADVKPVFPNTDAIEFWLLKAEFNNRMHARDRDRKHAIAEVKKEQALHQQNIALRKRDSISLEEFRKSEHDLAIANLEVESLEIQVKELEWDIKIVSLRYEGAIGRAVTLKDLMRLHVERWKTRVESAKLEVKRAEIDADFRMFLYALNHKLWVRKQLSDKEITLEKAALDKALADVALHKKRVEIAERSLKEAIDGVADAG